MYEYDPVAAVDKADMLQRFGYVKVEATSFTVSEPTEPLTISPLLYSEATEAQRDILENSYGVNSDNKNGTDLCGQDSGRRILLPERNEKLYQ